MSQSDPHISLVQESALKLRKSPFHRTEEIKFTWIIEDFLNRRRGRFRFVSPCFAIYVAGIETTWTVELYDHGDDWISTSLLREREDIYSVYTSFTISLLDTSSNETKSATLGLDMPASAYLSCEIQDWIRVTEIINNPDWLHDGDLKLMCQVKVEAKDQNLHNDCVGQIIQQFETLFTDKELSDVEIKCSGQVFYCHQIILATRSPVFKAMFQTNMKEKETRTVSIEEIAPEVLGEMLKFIYTGTLSSNNQISYVDLMGAAEQYQLELLKEVCEKKLCGMITLQNCLEYFCLGDFYPTTKLKDGALQFIVKNMATIVKTEEYKKFLQNSTDLALEITEAMIEKKTGDQSRQLVTSRNDYEYEYGLSDDDEWG